MVETKEKMEYEKCLVQLYEVLNHLEEAEYNKLPEELLEAIKQHKDNSYDWKYDESKGLKEQNLNRNTIIMLSYINSEYLLNEDEKALMEKIYELNEKKIEEEKREKYNPDNIFGNRKNDIQNKNLDENNIEKEEKALIEIKEQKWYQKVINYIKSIFKK
jgi:hypothetical protein